MVDSGLKMEWGLYWTDQNKPGWENTHNPFASSQHSVDSNGVDWVEYNIRRWGGSSETYTCVRFLRSGQPYLQAKLDRATGKFTVIKSPNDRDNGKTFDDVKSLVDFAANK